MSTIDTKQISHQKIKIVIVTLLTANVVIYALTDTLASTIDAAAWLLLLLLYELETVNRDQLAITTAMLDKIRLGLIMVIAAVFLAYMFQQEWLDVSNALLWYVLIAILEVEVRYPALFNRHARAFIGSAALIFLALIIMVVLWLIAGQWLDAYDATIWIVAFVLIEVDIVEYLRRSSQ